MPQHSSYVRAVAALAACTIGAAAAHADGRIVAFSGAHERDVQVYDRATGQVGWTITGLSGRFESEPLPAGEYMMISKGRVAAHVPVRDGETTTVRFQEQPGVDIASGTWSPARTRFDQSFVATGAWIRSVTFWLPGKPMPLAVELRADSPTGPLVGRHEFDSLQSWVATADFQPGAWRTVPGNRYALGIVAMDGRPFEIGTPSRGNVYADGIAYYDLQPAVDSDLAVSIGADNDGLITTARVTLGQGLGYVREGPASGFCRQAEQSFRATTRNIITAYANAGWSGDEPRMIDFVFSIHESGSDGGQIGPARRATMIKDWGVTVVWFPDQVSVQPGKRYALRMRRMDGKPFYAYLANDLYKDGAASRDGTAMPTFDLTCTIRGEREPGRLVYPVDASVESVDASSAIVRFRTGIPALARTTYGAGDSPLRHSPGPDAPCTEHELRLTGLRAGTAYRCHALAAVARGAAHEFRGPALAFSTPGVAPPDEPVASGQLVQLANPSFENGPAGWVVTPGTGQVRAATGPYRPHRGTAMFGYSDLPTDGEIPRQLEPAIRQRLHQNVALIKGRRYELAAWILTDDREGGWQRNGRIRLVADATGRQRLTRDKNDAPAATQWYSTEGKWQRVRLRFTATATRGQVGVDLYQWWKLAEHHLYVDEVSLHLLPSPATARKSVGGAGR